MMAQVSRDQSREATVFSLWWSDPGLKEKCCVKREKLKREIKKGKGGRIGMVRLKPCLV